MADQPLKYQTNAVQETRPGKWVRFSDVYGSGIRRQSYDGKYVYETHYDKGAGQPKTINVWGTDVATLPAPYKPGSVQDLLHQVAPKKVKTISKVVGGVEAGKSTAGAVVTGVAAAKETGGITAGITGASRGLSSVGLISNVARLAGPVILALAPMAIITGIMKAAGLKPFESPVANQIYGEDQGGGFYGAQPGNPGYKGAKFEGGQLVGPDKNDGRRDRSWYPDWIPEKVREAPYDEESKQYLKNAFKLDRLLRENVGRGLPTGNLYENYTDVTRYSDPAHGNRPTTYHFQGMVGEGQLIKLPGDLGLTYNARVAHGSKSGIEKDFGGKRFLANKTANYAGRALAASGGKMDPELAFQIGEEKAARDLAQLYNKLTVDPKGWTVAWGRHDNQLDDKTARLLIRTPNQLVYNAEKNQWQDPILGLKAVDQKEAQRRWELTRPVNQVNAKPKQGSVVQMTGSVRPAEQAVYKNGPGGLAWRDPRTNVVIDQAQAQTRWEATRPAGHKKDKPQEKSVVDLATGQWQSFTDKYGRTGYQRVGKNGQIFETRYNAAGTNQPPRSNLGSQFQGAKPAENTLLPAYNWPPARSSIPNPPVVRPAGPGRGQTVGTKEEPAQPGRQLFQARGSQTDDKSPAGVGPATSKTAAPPTYNETELHKYDEIESRRLAAGRTPPPVYQGAGTPVSSEHFIDKKGRLNTITTLASGAKIQQVEGGTAYRISGPTSGPAVVSGSTADRIAERLTAQPAEPVVPTVPDHFGRGHVLEEDPYRTASPEFAAEFAGVSMPPETKPLAEIEAVLPPTGLPQQPTPTETPITNVGATNPMETAGAQNPLTTPPSVTPTGLLNGLSPTQSETPGIFKHGRWLEM